MEASKGMKGGVGWLCARVAASGHCPLAAGSPEMLSQGRMTPGAAETLPLPSPTGVQTLGSWQVTFTIHNVQREATRSSNM